MHAGAFEEAIGLFSESIRFNPHFKTLELLGESLIRVGRLREAIVPLAGAVGLNRQARAAILLAETFLALEDLPAARSQAEIAITREPHSTRAREIVAAIQAARQLEE